MSLVGVEATATSGVVSLCYIFADSWSSMIFCKSKVSLLPPDGVLLFKMICVE
jgi:hypothetical protein